MISMCFKMWTTCGPLPGRLQQYTCPNRRPSQPREQPCWEMGSPPVFPHSASPQTCIWHILWPLLGNIVHLPQSCEKNSKSSCSATHKFCFHFLIKGEMWPLSLKSWFFIWENPKLPNGVPLMMMCNRSENTCACRNECHQAKYAALWGFCTRVTEKRENSTDVFTVASFHV